MQPHHHVHISTGFAVLVLLVIAFAVWLCVVRPLAAAAQRRVDERRFEREERRLHQQVALAKLMRSQGSTAPSARPVPREVRHEVQPYPPYVAPRRPQPRRDYSPQPSPVSVAQPTVVVASQSPGVAAAEGFVAGILVEEALRPEREVVIEREEPLFCEPSPSIFDGGGSSYGGSSGSDGGFSYDSGSSPFDSGSSGGVDFSF